MSIECASIMLTMESVYQVAAYKWGLMLYNFLMQAGGHSCTNDMAGALGLENGGVSL